MSTAATSVLSVSSVRGKLGFAFAIGKFACDVGGWRLHYEEGGGRSGSRGGMGEKVDCCVT